MIARLVGLLLFTGALLCACGGGGGGSSSPTAPTPTPAVPSPMPTSTTFAGGASLAASFTSNYPAAARSVVFTFTSGTTSFSNLAILPSGCGSSCSATVSAPVGINQSIQALLYASSTGTGTSLAVSNSTASFLSNQTTTNNFGLTGVMASYTLTLNPSTVTVGQSVRLSSTENAFDAAGEALAPGYVTTALTAPAWGLPTVTDPSGLSTSNQYSGVGNGPMTYTVQVTNPNTNYQPASASLQFTAASPITPGYAVFSLTNGAGSQIVSCTIGVYQTGSTTAARIYGFAPSLCSFNAYPHFDASGNIWGIGGIGIKADGTSAGPLGLKGTLLAFDHAGNAYVSDPSVAALDIYSGVGGSLSHQITTAATPAAAAVDPSGNIYVGIPGAGIINEYAPPTSNGSLTPTATFAGASQAQSDATGSIYAPDNGVTVWSPGSFAGSPNRTISASGCGCNSVAVDRSGNVYAIGNAAIYAQGVIVRAQPGSSSSSPISPSTFQYCTLQPGAGCFNYVIAPP